MLAQNSTISQLIIPLRVIHRTNSTKFMQSKTSTLVQISVSSKMKTEKKRFNRNDPKNSTSLIESSSLASGCGTLS